MSKTRTALAAVLCVATTHISVAQAPAPSQPSVTDRWKESQSNSPFDDSPTVVLRLSADEPVPVWLKSVVPILIVRCKERALDAYVDVQSPANVETGDSRSVRVRFNQLTAKNEYWSESSDHTALFSPKPAGFLKQLQTANRFLFGFTPFSAPPVVVTFSPAGLSRHLTRLSAACPDAILTDEDRAAQRAKQAEVKRAEQERELRRPTATAASLVGKPLDVMKAALGEASTMSPTRFGYETTTGDRLYVSFSGNAVTEVSQPSLALTNIKRASPGASVVPEEIVKPPDGAVARCRDGLFVFVFTGADACSGHGGVYERLAQPAVPAAAATAPAVAQPTPPPTETPPPPKRPATELMGLRQDAVRQRLGAPSLIANNIWYYDTSAGTLRVVFSEDTVSDTQPKSFDLAVLTERPAPPPPTPAPPEPPKRPAGAVAQCGDGKYVFVSTGAKTCSGNGGVKEWFVKQ